MTIKIMKQPWFEPDGEGRWKETQIANLVIVVPPENYKEFQELVQRGANLWPDSSAAIKTFADMVTNGRVMQKYEEQTVNKVKGR